LGGKKSDILSLEEYNMTYIYVLDFDDIECYFRIECVDSACADKKVSEIRDILSTRESRTAIITSPSDLSKDRISEIFLDWQLEIIKEILIKIRDNALKDEVHISKMLKRRKR
jgi:hypothetical protein